MHIEIKPLLMHSQKNRNFHVPLAFDKRRGGASTAKDLRFSPQSLNIKQFNINMHPNKVFKKA